MSEINDVQMKCQKTIRKALDESGPMDFQCLKNWTTIDQAFEPYEFDNAVEALVNEGEVRVRGNRIYLTYGEEPLTPTVETWNFAMGWARDNGARIHKGKVTRTLARARIYEAGLMHEFNKAWPEYSFNSKEGEEAVSYLESEERAKIYRLRQRIRNKGGDWKVRG